VLVRPMTPVAVTALFAAWLTAIGTILAWTIW
jgi:hypothetical protein